MSDPTTPKKPSYSVLKNLPFVLVHLVALIGVFVMGWSWKGAALAVGLYYLRMFGVTAGYHRYFSHRTFRTSRFFQFVLAFLAVSSTQKGVLWWASHHRLHHKLSDKEGDVHSMKRDGFFWSHVGWIMSDEHDATDEKRISDLTRYPELRFLDRFHVLPTLVLCAVLVAAGGLHALFWGYFVSTVFLWHGTFTINSLCHYLGKPRYVTGDESKNSLFLALITMGEGWHNNHHYYQRSTAQGFFWWEIDMTFYLLKALSWVGVVWDLQTASDEVKAKNLLRPKAKSEAEPEGLEVPVLDASPADAE